MDNISPQRLINQGFGSENYSYDRRKLPASIIWKSNNYCKAEYFYQLNCTKLQPDRQRRAIDLPSKKGGAA